jgi:hypothetical protein
MTQPAQTILYSNGITRIGLTILVTMNEKGEKYINITGPPQYVIIYDFYGSCSKVFELALNKGIVNQRYDVTTRTKGPPVMMSFIYNVKTLAKAKLYQTLMPNHNDISHVTAVNVRTAQEVMMVQRGHWTGVHNCGKEDLYYGEILLPVKTCIYIRYTGNLPDLKFRKLHGSVPNGMSYDHLTAEERVQYIPDCILNGIYTINASTAYDWVDAEEQLYRGSLTYQETRDKEIRMVTDDGRTLRYNIESMRPLFPHLVQGVVKGTFIFKGKGTRNIKYVLSPLTMKQNTSDLILCDSSDSEAEDELEPMST